MADMRANSRHIQNAFTIFQYEFINHRIRYDEMNYAYYKLTSMSQCVPTSNKYYENDSAYNF